MGKKTQSSQLHPTSRVLVTGGAGFIGSALIHALNQRGVHDILVTDILSTDQKWKNLVPIVFKDYLDAEELMNHLKNKPRALGHFDFIFHLGACSSTTEKDAAYLMRNNYAYTRDLCDWAISEETRFVYASSAATYGDGAGGMDDKNPAIEKLRPLNMYGYSKQVFDLYARQQEYLDHIVGIKYFNVFGPNEYHKGTMRSMVCKAYEQICQTGECTLFRSHRHDYKDGEQMRDFVYVKDAINVTLHLAETKSANGLFNVGAGTARTWLDLAKALFAALDRPTNIRFIDMPEEIRNQYQYYTRADISKLLATGYQTPFTSLEDSVADYVKNYLIPGKHLGE